VIAQRHVMNDVGNITSDMTSFYTAHREAAFMQATQWQDTVANDNRDIGCCENIQIRNRWLDDSHCGPAGTLPAIGCESSM